MALGKLIIKTKAKMEVVTVEMMSHQPSGERILSWESSIEKTVEESPKERWVKIDGNHEKFAENKRVKFQERKGVKERFEDTKD